MSFPRLSVTFCVCATSLRYFSASACIIFLLYFYVPRWIADNYRVRFYVMGDNRSRPYHRVMAYSNSRQNNRPCADAGIIFYDRRKSLVVFVLYSWKLVIGENNARPNEAVIANLGVVRDKHPVPDSRMFPYQAVPTYLRAPSYRAVVDRKSAVHNVSKRPYLDVIAKIDTDADFSLRVYPITHVVASLPLPDISPTRILSIKGGLMGSRHSLLPTFKSAILR